jgi:hypothetical protein
MNTPTGDATDGLGTFYMEVTEESPSGEEVEVGEEEEEEEEVVAAVPPSLRQNEEEDDEEEEESNAEVIEEEEDRVLYCCKVVFYFCRVVVLFAVVVTALFNLTNAPGQDSMLWTALLSSCVGYALSARKLKGKKKKTRNRTVRRHRRRPKHFRVEARDDGLDILHTLAKQQFDARVP